MRSPAALCESFNSLVPRLSVHAYKGQAGKIGVIGGCEEYTGAPFFAAMSALNIGVDLSTVMCMPEAEVPIKSYSPDLMVQGTLVPSRARKSAGDDLDRLLDWLPKLDTLVMGPGLGRDLGVLRSVAAVIGVARRRDMPMVLDGDALWLIATDPELIMDYHKAVLTPNAMEFRRLWEAAMPADFPVPPLRMEVDVHTNESVEEIAIHSSTLTKQTAELANALGGLTIVRKGQVDVISDGSEAFLCSEVGSLRRVGGQGDVLAGVTGAFVSWANRHETPMSLAIAALAATQVVRKASHRAFAKHGRRMLASHVMQEVYLEGEAPNE